MIVDTIEIGNLCLNNSLRIKFKDCHNIKNSHNRAQKQKHTPKVQ